MTESFEEYEQLARESLAAFNEGDYERALEHAHPDVVMKRLDGSPDSHELIRGKQAVIDFLAPDVFESQEIVPVQIVAGPDSVLIHIRFRARGSGSGLEFETDAYMVYEVCDRAVSRIASYRERADAERDAGLEF